MTRKETWFTVIGVFVGLVVMIVLGVYTVVTSMPPLHSNPQDVPSVVDATPSQEWAGAVELARQIARAHLVEQNLPGLSVAVGANGKIVWAEGFGWADFDNKVPVAPNTLFRIGHVSKPLTSAAVGLLLEKGRLHLDDEIQTHVPSFPRKQWPVTLRQLMGHTSGITHYRRDDDYMRRDHCDRASKGLAAFEQLPLRFEPETQYGY